MNKVSEKRAINTLMTIALDLNKCKLDQSGAHVLTIEIPTVDLPLSEPLQMIADQLREHYSAGDANYVMGELDDALGSAFQLVALRSIIKR